MCGIFGYVGTKSTAAEMVLDGLKLLEYRGYDSWGIAVKATTRLQVDKHTGKLGDATTSLPESSMGIGHTRWATHGGVTVENAHPHLDCTKNIAVVHNGIVENYTELKDTLVKNGHSFVSQTDTEVIPHLIEENLKTQDFQSAVKKTFNTLHGLNAVVVLNSATNEIIAAKNGSPLIIGKAEDGYYLASDAAGIIKYTRELLFLKDNEMVVMGKTLELYSLPDGKALTPHFETINWNIEDATMGKYPHFMIKEIHEQPKVILNIAENYTGQIEKMAEIVKQAQGTFFIGAGTAYHACMVGAYLFSKVAKIHTNTTVASEFNYLEDFLTDKSLIVALSQSGETIDVIEPLNHAREKGVTILGFTNTLGSTIYRMSDHKLLLGAGPEKAVASTKAYITKVAVLLMLSHAMKGKINGIREKLIAAAAEIERMLEDKNLESMKQLAKTLVASEHIYIIGRGLSYPSALEAALKIKEVSYIHTEGLAGGELKHGTIALISKGIPCIVFAPNDETYEAIISNATEIKARGAVIIGVSYKNNPIFDQFIEVKDLAEATILTQVIPTQLLGYYLALEKGYDPDKPRNLAKSVTVK